MVCFNLIRKSHQLMPQMILDGTFLTSLVRFLKISFGFTQSVFYFEFFLHILQDNNLVILMLVDLNLVEECFDFLSLFVLECTRTPQYELNEEQVCYQELLYFFINKIILILLKVKKDKPFYVDYIKSIISLPCIEALEQFALYGLTHKKRLEFLHPHYFGNNDSKDMAFILEYLLVYFETYFYEQVDFFFFSRIFGLNKFCTQKQDQYDIKENEYKHKDFIFTFNIIFDDKNQKIEQIMQSSQENYSVFIQKFDQKFNYISNYTIFYLYDQDQEKEQVVDDKVEYIKMLHNALMNDDSVGNNVQIDVFMRNVILHFSNCYQCGISQPLIEMFSLDDGNTFCAQCSKMYY